MCLCVWRVLLKHLRGGCEGHAVGQAAAAPYWPVAVRKLLAPLTVGLVAHAQDDFRGAVVAGHHIGCHEEAGGGRPGQAKIQNLQCAVRLHHYVTGLQVLCKKATMKDEAN